MKDSRQDPTDPAPAVVPSKPPPLTWQEQSDQIAELLLASARRLATDPKHLAEIKKLLF